MRYPRGWSYTHSIQCILYLYSTVPRHSLLCHTKVLWSKERPGLDQPLGTRWRSDSGEFPWITLATEPRGDSGLLPLLQFVFGRRILLQQCTHGGWVSSDLTCFASWNVRAVTWYTASSLVERCSPISPLLVLCHLNARNEPERRVASSVMQAPFTARSRLVDSLACAEDLGDHSRLGSPVSDNH